MTHPLPPAKVQAYADRNGLPPLPAATAAALARVAASVPGPSLHTDAAPVVSLASAEHELRKIDTGGAIDAERIIAAGGGRDHAIRVLAAELNRLRGVGLRTDPRASELEVSLGEASVLIEYSYRAEVPGRTWGPPEDCYEDEPEELEILSVLINGATVDASPDLFSAAVLAEWEQAIRDEVQRLADDAAADAGWERAYG